MQQVQFSLHGESGQLVEKIIGPFEPDDLVLFRQFVAMMSKVRTCTLLQRGMPAIGNIKMQSGSAMSFTRIWLNGEQYHTDAEKASAWQALESTLNTENARALVMNQLQGRVKTLFNREHLVTLVLTKSRDA